MWSTYQYFFNVFYYYNYYYLFYFPAEFIGFSGRGFQTTRHRDAEDVFVAKLIWQRLGQPIVVVKCFAHVQLFFFFFCCIIFVYSFFFFFLNSLALAQRHLVDSATSIPELRIGNTDSDYLLYFVVIILIFIWKYRRPYNNLYTVDRLFCLLFFFFRNINRMMSKPSCETSGSCPFVEYFTIVDDSRGHNDICYNVKTNENIQPTPPPVEYYTVCIIPSLN